jgi:DNA polymerase-3 subunit epsilon
MSHHFVAIDLETANRNTRSICQIGIVVYEDGREVASDVVLVDPREPFEAMNIRVHGIRDSHVAGAACFPDLHGWLEKHLQDRIVVAHGNFDRGALKNACAHHVLPAFACRWLDSVTIARRAWPHLRGEGGGHGLANLARVFGVQFRHHDALEDARAAGLLTLRALDETGWTLEYCFGRAKPRIVPIAEGQGAPLQRAP